MSAEKKSDNATAGEKRFTIRFEADFYDKLLVAMGDKRVRFIQTAVIKALEQWMGKKPAALDPARSDPGSTGQTQVVKSPVPKDHPQPGKIPDSVLESDLQPWLQILNRVLASGVPEVVNAIKSNLLAFDLIARSHMESSRGKTGINGSTTPENQHQRMDKLLVEGKAIERDLEIAERLVREARTPKPTGGRTRKRSGGGKGSHLPDA